ncbi:MAG: PAS domain S-box protein, partial [Chthoniobacteraceae bacterium]
MPSPTPPDDSLRAEVADLRARLEESEETLRAIRSGDVDALVVEGPAGPQVFTLEGAEAEANRFRSDILAKVSDAVVATDENQHVIFFNAAAERQYGLTASAALGRQINELFIVRWLQPDEADLMEKALREQGWWRGESIHRKRDGTEFHVESSVSCLLDKAGSTYGRLSVIRDITPRRRAEDALRASEESFRTLANAIPQLAWMAHADGFIHWYNERWYEYTGTMAEQMEGWGWQSVHDPTYLPDVLERWKGSLSTGQPFEMIFPLRGADGQFRPFLTRVHPVRDTEGRILQWFGTNTDVGEMKRAEETLRQNEALFFEIIEQAPGGVYVVDDDFRVLKYNTLARPAFAAAEPVVGRDFAEVMGILWGPELGPKLAEVFRHTLRTGEQYISPPFTEQRHDLGIPKSYDWEVHRLTLPNGRFGVVCYFTDTTDQRALEAALRASEQRATSIIQSIADGFMTMDVEWRITYLSPRGAEILAPLQKTSESVLGKILWDEFPATAGTVVEKHYRQSFREQVATQFENYYAPLARWFDVRVYPSPLGLTVYFLDITDRKESEEALRRSEQTLAAQAGALRAADRSKDEFLAMLAHELRNPLAPLRNAAELLKADNISGDERRQAQRILGRQIENMSRMLDDLLDVSRITEGKITLRKQPVALEAILTSAASLMRSGCAARGQTLTVRLPTHSIFLEADNTRLEQVFTNLLGNASKYGGDGCHIELIAERADRHVVVRVRDDGAGIDAELLSRIFDLFVQASRTLDRSHGGLGIGLTLVQRLVKLHDGSIQARSEGEGKGAEFIVRLPLLSS